MLFELKISYMTPSAYKGVDKWGLRGLKPSPPKFLTKVSVGKTKRRDQVLPEFEINYLMNLSCTQVGVFTSM